MGSKDFGGLLAAVAAVSGQSAALVRDLVVYVTPPQWLSALQRLLTNAATAMDVPNIDALNLKALLHTSGIVEVAELYWQEFGNNDFWLQNCEAVAAKAEKFATGFTNAFPEHGPWLSLDESAGACNFKALLKMSMLVLWLLTFTLLTARLSSCLVVRFRFSFFLLSRSFSFHFDFDFFHQNSNFNWPELGPVTRQGGWRSARVVPQP